jgi:hypothetical protein
MDNYITIRQAFVMELSLTRALSCLKYPIDILQLKNKPGKTNGTDRVLKNIKEG